MDSITMKNFCDAVGLSYSTIVKNVKKSRLPHTRKEGRTNFYKYDDLLKVTTMFKQRLTPFFGLMPCDEVVFDDEKESKLRFYTDKQRLMDNSIILAASRAYR